VADIIVLLRYYYYFACHQVHRLAENICGDWSEHISSTGKRYYYNCRTEISQWEKPKDWNNLYALLSVM